MSSDNPISDYSSVIGFLSHLTTDELKSVLNDDAKLDELLKEVKQVSFKINVCLKFMNFQKNDYCILSHIEVSWAEKFI